MNDKTFEVQPGDEIIISVSRKPTADKIPLPRASAPKAMIRARRFGEHLPRRAGTRGIRIYDLSRVKSGAIFTDLIYSSPATITGTGISFTHGEPGSALYDGLRALLFASPDSVESLPDNAEAIQPGSARDYQLTVLSKTFETLYSFDDPLDRGKFTAHGLKISPPSAIGAISIRNGETCFNLPDFAKITQIFGADAPPVPFDFQGTESVFLMPRIFFIGAKAVDSVFATSPRRSQIWYLNYIFAVLPRSFLRDPEFSDINFFVNAANPPDTARYRRVWEAINLTRARFAARAGYSEFIGSGFPPFAPISASDFAQPIFPDDAPTPTIDYDTLREEAKFLGSECAPQSPDLPRLLAVVFQGAHKFFFWHPGTV